MRELLSNDEIEALLEVVRVEGTELAVAEVAGLGVNEPMVSGPQVRALDLFRPNRLNRLQLSSLERVFQNAAAAMSTAIAGRLRLELACDCVAVEQMAFDMWADQVVGTSGIYVLRMTPFDQPVLFTVTADLLYAAVDRVLGGTGEVHEVPSSFSTAEFTVADALVRPCVDQICMGLSELVPIEWEVETRTCNMSIARVISPYDVVLSVYFQVSGDFLFGDVRLVIPLSQLDPYLNALSIGHAAGFKHTTGSMRSVVGRSMQNTPLDLSVKFGDASVRLRDLLRLNAGDVIPLDHDAKGQVVASVGGRPKFEGRLGRHGSQLALEIDRVVQENSDG